MQDWKADDREKANSYKESEENYLAYYFKEGKELRIYELREPNIKYLKPIIFSLYESDIASSIEYDQTYGRIFYFSNASQ
jgi:hypothetical protein